MMVTWTRASSSGGNPNSKNSLGKMTHSAAQIMWTSCALAELRLGTDEYTNKYFLKIRKIK